MYWFNIYIFKIWQVKRIQKVWQVVIIITLHKKGDRMVVENCRCISLLCVANKYGRVVEGRLKKLIEPTLGDSQAELRNGRNAQEWVNIL